MQGDRYYDYDTFGYLRRAKTGDRIIFYARNRSAPLFKEDGLILRSTIGDPKEGDKWSWRYSEDRWGEQEVLLKGPRSGDVEAFKP